MRYNSIEPEGIISHRTRRLVKTNILPIVVLAFFLTCATIVVIAAVMGV